jgi:hypothetical protein
MPAYSDAAAVTLLTGVTSGGTTLAAGTNLFSGPPRPHGSGIPLGPVVFCLATGGAASEPYLGTNKDLNHETVQITVRSKNDKFADGLALARACRAALHKKQPSGFIDTQVREPDAVHIGLDGNDCHLFVLNVVARVVRSTA